MNGDGQAGPDGGDSLKNPPSWSAEGEGRYPFEKYEQDMRLWIAATSLTPSQIGPAIALRLSGTARELARACDPNDLINGRTDVDMTTGQQIHMPGYELLLQALKKRFSPLDQEQEIASIQELFGFRRKAGETIDELINIRAS